MNHLNNISVCAYFKRIVNKGEKQTLCSFTSFKNLKNDKLLTFEFTANVNNGLVNLFEENKTPVLITGELRVSSKKDKNGKWKNYTSIFVKDLIPFVGASGLNEVIIQGHLVDEMEPRVLPTTTIYVGKIANNREFYSKADGKKEFTSFIEIVAGHKFGTLMPYMNKGKLILVKGSMTTQKWQSEDGTWHEKPVLNVNQVYFTTKANDDKTKNSAKPNSTKPKVKDTANIPSIDEEPTEVPF
jgi:single-stranded DNA-binding protein